ncbi:ATP-binding protein [Streptomyces diacarni]|uniref:ATP-binding protein n=1 Tax=Streptomyces diacarni TaxID=2800381 RepID=A0A367F124_9ACTN|nr:ATP-binding protein [Streptomyces diacarni]RCG24078.1 ATP-binding protein [Streptomyces diacarni]
MSVHVLTKTVEKRDRTKRPPTGTSDSSELLPQTSRAFAVAFAPDSARVPEIRRTAGTILRSWNLPTQLVEDVQLAVSELLANALEHGDGDIEARVLRVLDEVRIEVTDDNPEPAQLRCPDVDDLSGRGLLLVAALAQSWGVSRDGRTTWCSFRLARRA